MASHKKIEPAKEKTVLNYPSDKYRWRKLCGCLLLLIFPSLCGIEDSFARQITDMAGRKVNIPDKITRVLPYDNKTNALLYPVAGNLMIAKARAMENPNLKYIAKDFLSKKEIDTKNAEEIIKLKPELIIVGAFVSEKEDLSNYILFAKKVNIPLIVVDLELMKLDRSYEFMGNLLGKPTEGKQCADFIRSVYQNAEHYKKGKRVPGKGYMANDNNGQRTAPRGSKHAQLFDIMSITNAVNTPLDSKGFALVNMEQVLASNPDYIFCVGKGETSPYHTVLKSALWRNITAVRNKRTFYVPSQPYLWFDMPPSVNRILGIIWFSDIFYEQPEEITKQKVTKFYQIFYHYNLTEKEYANLFKWQ